MLLEQRHSGLHWLLIGWGPRADVWELSCDSGSHARTHTHEHTHILTHTFLKLNEGLGWVLTGREAHMLSEMSHCCLRGDYILNKYWQLTHTRTHITTPTTLISQDWLTPCSLKIMMSWLLQYEIFILHLYWERGRDEWWISMWGRRACTM